VLNLGYPLPVYPPAFAYYAITLQTYIESILDLCQEENWGENFFLDKLLKNGQYGFARCLHYMQNQFNGLSVG
jgi:hypothetical protein